MLKYAVVGNPIHHSWSPFIHQQFSKQTNIPLSYEALRLDATDCSVFKESLKTLAQSGYLGINITLPYKTWAFEIMQTSHGLSERAKSAGAVNCITFTNQHQWLADNTDGIGFMRDLKNNLGWNLSGCNILLLGAGGAARGILPTILEEKPARLDILNRDLYKAKELAKKFNNVSCEINGLERVDKTFYDCIINATSASLAQQLPSTLSQISAKNARCYDMVYASQPTIFLQWAISKNAQATSDGLGMLVEQAAESFYQWHKKMPATKIVIEQLRNQLLGFYERL
jgi:shikimate dehydrogenase